MGYPSDAWTLASLALLCVWAVATSGSAFLVRAVR